MESVDFLAPRPGYLKEAARLPAKYPAFPHISLPVAKKLSDRQWLRCTLKVREEATELSGAQRTAPAQHEQRWLGVAVGEYARSELSRLVRDQRAICV